MFRTTICLDDVFRDRKNALSPGLTWEGLVVLGLDSAEARQKIVEMAIPGMPPESNQEIDSIFDEFWKLYPKKVGKLDARRAWKKIREPKATLEKIKAALAWQIVSAKWTEENGSFIPHPATYLNGGRWEDEKSMPINQDNTNTLPNIPSPAAQRQQAKIDRPWANGHGFKKDP